MRCSSTNTIRKIYVRPREVTKDKKARTRAPDPPDTKHLHVGKVMKGGAKYKGKSELTSSNLLEICGVSIVIGLPFLGQWNHQQPTSYPWRSGNGMRTPAHDLCNICILSWGSLYPNVLAEFCINRVHVLSQAFKHHSVKLPSSPGSITSYRGAFMDVNPMW